METEKRLIDIEYLEAYAVDIFGAKFIPCAALKDIAAVDAVEVVHGFWTAEPPYFSECCSVCGYCPDKKINHNYKYCPNCGAKMDGDGNEND